MHSNKTWKTLYNPYKYSGYEQDRLKTDYYLNARTYRPSIGRFLQEENYRGDGLKLYVYVADNSIIYVDPSGYKCAKVGMDEGTVIKAANGEYFPAEWHTMLESFKGMDLDWNFLD